jgi:hypothetical protein
MRLLPLSSMVCLFTFILISAGCGSPTAPVIGAQPSNQIVAVGQTATFSALATGSPPLSYQWQKGQTPIPGATAANYTTPATSISDSGTQFSVVVSNSSGNTPSKSAKLMVYVPTDVLTYHNDIARTGQNLTESILTTANVTSVQFGKIGFYPVDGPVDAQPLYASSIAVPNEASHNLLFVSTEHDSVYAFDADSGATIWHASMLQPGETTTDDRGCINLVPEIGVTSTSVIDRNRGPNGAIYVVSASAASQNGSTTYHQRLHALDLTSGEELLGGPVDIQATYPGKGDNSNGTSVVFDPAQYLERAALLLLNGVVYTSWSSHCDFGPYTGWIIGYSGSTLAQTSVLNVTPNGSFGGIWMSGSGPAADSSGNIYFADGNGDFDDTMNSAGFPSNGDYGNAFIKLSTSGALAVADYFEVGDEATENANDGDFGSGGVLVLPDLNDGSGHTLHLAVGAGKDGNLYVVNRDSMGKFKVDNSNVYEELAGALPGGVWASPAYFNNTVYYGSVGDPIQAFAITNAKMSSGAGARTANSFAYPGSTPRISANGTNNAIVWAIENVPGSVFNPGGGTQFALAVLHAYNASNLSELYNSNQANDGRDQFPSNKFITPIIVNGKVFVGTSTGVAVFGILPEN